MGYCVGIVPLRGRIDPACPFADMLRTVHGSTLECFANAMPFVELVRALGDVAAPGHNPIFQVRFALQNHPVPDVEVASLRGPLVVNLWASWCGPCREEMPVIQQFHEQHGERVQVLDIDYEDPQVESAMDLVGETGVTYPLLADPQSSLQGAGPFPGLMGLPMFAFVDEDGTATVVAQKVDSVGELEGLVDEHLGIRL